MKSETKIFFCFLSILLSVSEATAQVVCEGSPKRMGLFEIGICYELHWHNCTGVKHMGRQQTVSGTFVRGKLLTGIHTFHDDGETYVGTFDEDCTLIEGKKTLSDGSIEVVSAAADTKSKPVKNLTKTVKSSSNPKPSSSALRDQFKQLSLKQRKKVQSNLRSKTFYTSSIDGLYGKGTAAALKAYNKEYLGNADLTKKANVDALFADILKPQPSEDTLVAAAQLEPESATPEPKPEPAVTPAAEPEEAPITLADMQLAYDSRDYSKAREAAEALAIQGEADAQFLLGKMYAEGLGTLQISKTAHMWFNIASLNGSAEAINERNRVAETMTASAVEEAQELALKCIQSKYEDCGLSIAPKQKPEVQQPVVAAILDGAALVKAFKAQSVLRRKQLQYALKKLGVYSSSVDGLWGNGTRRAFTIYIEKHELKVTSGEEVFASVLSKIDVPSTFAAAPPPKKKQRKTIIDTAGLTAIIASPTISGSQALAICEPQAKMTAQNDYDQSRSSGNKKITCKTKSDILGSKTKCKESSGGWPGLLPLLLEVDPESQANKKANSTYQLALSSCLAQYGWKK